VPWARTNADDVAFRTIFQVYRVGNGVELVTIVRYGTMGRYPSWAELKWCHRRTARRVRAHNLICIDMDPRRRVVAKVDTIVEAH
jgi:hypothetical protein